MRDSRFLAVLSLLLSGTPDVFAADLAVQPLFDPKSLAGAPFPSDSFTVEDAAQLTGLRVELPLPDCVARPSDCEDVRVLNQLDGFNLQPRLSIPFSGAIDVGSVDEKAVLLLRLGAARVVGINQVVWDPATNTLHAMSGELLDEHTRYALVVTRRLRAASGARVEAAPAFRRFRHGPRGRYQQALEEGMRAARRAGLSEADVAVASVFTTQTVSHVIERMREAIRRSPVAALEIGTAEDGSRAVFDAAGLERLTRNDETRSAGPLTPVEIRAVAGLRVVPGAVGTLAFGSFRALDFTTRPGAYIEPIPTRTGRLEPQRSVDVAFDLALPAGSAPAAGWPVALCGHGSSIHKDWCLTTAGMLASHGIAVLSINAMGHGFGPRTTTTFTRTNGNATTFASPGLGYDANGDGAIAAWEGRAPARPLALHASSGTIVQTAALYLQLARAVQAGVDVDRDGRRDLDAARIYYYGHSLGAMYGMIAFAYEPAIRAAVFVAPAGTLAHNTRLGVFRPLQGAMLAARTPPLAGAEGGLRSIDGRAVEGPFYDENLPLRNEAPRINQVPGAMAVQQVLDRLAWVQQIGNCVAYAPRLRRSPPSGIPARPFLLQFARSDPASANPGTTEIVRAGAFADRAVLYRHDLNFGNEGVLPNSHTFIGAVASAPAYLRVVLGAQRQIATFFESDGAKLIHPEPAELWEVPVKGPLPEDTLYLPRVPR